MLPKQVRRRIREYGFVAIKAIFLVGMGILWLNDLLIDIFWLRPVVNFLGRCIGYFDGWLRSRPLWFVFVAFGILGAIGVAINFYKGYLLVSGQLGLFALVEIVEKFSYGVLLHHLWHVYRDRLLEFAFIRYVYDKCMMIRTEAILWVLASDWYREAAATAASLAQEWAAIRSRIREDWFRYSMAPYAKRAARTRPCCLLNWL